MSHFELIKNNDLGVVMPLNTPKAVVTPYSVVEHKISKGCIDTKPAGWPKFKEPNNEKL